jgi:peptidoglycan/xylan/chitin deacetylase (PgdA/CDA1 family)
MNPISNPIIWRIQKHRSFYRSLLFRNAPKFVYNANPGPIENDIPVFTFHTALPDRFEEQCRFLSENGYRTLTADEFYRALTRRDPFPEKAVVLTFDDGLKTVWTVAYPLLRKYGLKAVCFLIPGCIPEDEGTPRMTLEDYWNGQASLQDVAPLGQGPGALMNWSEIKTLHETGIVDFQSHTLYHHLVPVSEKIFDFYHPTYNAHFYGNIHIPVYMENGQDVVTRDPVLGMPIYYSKPRMQAVRRYFEDEGLRACCVDLVRQEGEKAFFDRRFWRRELRAAVQVYRKEHGVRGHFETVEQRNQSILADLRQSREWIEARLPGKSVTHLCFPWYDAADFAVQLSAAAGFRCNYFGQLWGRTGNPPGSDPSRIVRVEGHFLQRLPGKGRLTIVETLGNIYGLKAAPVFVRSNVEEGRWEKTARSR